MIEARIDENGGIRFIPSNSTEEYALSCWMKNFFDPKSSRETIGYIPLKEQEATHEGD